MHVIAEGGSTSTSRYPPEDFSVASRVKRMVEWDLVAGLGLVLPIIDIKQPPELLQQPASDPF
jgi:hypothetical protein